MSKKANRPRDGKTGAAKLKALRQEVQKGLDSGPSRPLNMEEVKRQARRRQTPDCQMTSVRWHPLTEEDLIGIWLRTFSENPTLADGFLDALDRRMQLLTASPGLGRRRPGLAHAFDIPIPGYLIVYRADDDGIEVVRVLDDARDIGALFRDGQ